MNNEAENRENTGKDLADQVGKAPVLATRSSLPPLEDYVEKLKAIWDSAWLTNMGQFHEELKQELKEYLQVSGLELFVNGHMALEMILQAMELKGEVITTPFSFASTTHAIVRNGLTPVFCDIREDNFTLDADKLEDLITEKTCAIVPTHVYGNICDVEKDPGDRRPSWLEGHLRCSTYLWRNLSGCGRGKFWRCIDVQLPCYQGVSHH